MDWGVAFLLVRTKQQNFWFWSALLPQYFSNQAMLDCIVVCNWNTAQVICMWIFLLMQHPEGFVFHRIALFFMLWKLTVFWIGLLVVGCCGVLIFGELDISLIARFMVILLKDGLRLIFLLQMLRRISKKCSLHQELSLKLAKFSKRVSFDLVNLSTDLKCSAVIIEIIFYFVLVDVNKT